MRLCCCSDAERVVSRDDPDFVLAGDTVRVVVAVGYLAADAVARAVVAGRPVVAAVQTHAARVVVAGRLFALVQDFVVAPAVAVHPLLRLLFGWLIGGLLSLSCLCFSCFCLSCWSGLCSCALVGMLIPTAATALSATVQHSPQNTHCDS